MSYFHAKTSQDTSAEKQAVEIYENSGPQYSVGATFDSAQTGRLLRKMDLNIVPFLALLYL